MAYTIVLKQHFPFGLKERSLDLVIRDVGVLQRVEKGEPGGASSWIKC